MTEPAAEQAKGADAPPPTEEDVHEYSTTSTSYDFEPQRDEVKEVRRESQKETRIIRLWRVVVTLVLLAVATAVTLSTYTFLQDAEDETFEEAFKQFSDTIGNAAYKHQESVREGYKALAEAFEARATHANATWPFYTMPYFENRARHARTQARTELAGVGYIVRHEELEEWLNFTDNNYEEWVEEGHMLTYGNLDRLNKNSTYHSAMTNGISPHGTERDFYTPSWTFSPPPSGYGLINWDARTTYDANIQAAIKLHNLTLLTEVTPYTVAVPLAFSEEEHADMHSEIAGSSTHHPHAFIFHPVRERLQDPESRVVAFVVGTMGLDAALQNLLPPRIELTVVIRNNCGQSFTYDIKGSDAFYIESGRRSTEYDDKMETRHLYENHTDRLDFFETPGHCFYSMDIYPNENLREFYNESTPEVFAAVVALTFVLVAVVFVVYDIFVQNRNEKMVSAAARSNAVVSSIFPGKYRDEMMGQMMNGGALENGMNGGSPGNPSRSKPLADLILESTILFADIAGFTAWSSVREPYQVFTLLETVYGAFDKLAKKRGIFKVETVGDCYVAASGIPNARNDHAVAMCRFARDIMMQMNVLTKQLIVDLGPDTGDLTIRVGVHSGPVTAGVLRGERARFQLFGDTINTTSKMESTGSAGKIQLSTTTADLVKQAGKTTWMKQRADRVVARGRGEMVTYWLLLGNESTVDRISRTVSDDSGELADNAESGANPKPKYSQEVLESLKGDDYDQRTRSLIDWNTGVLARLLSAVVDRRNSNPRNPRDSSSRPEQRKATCFLDEVVEIIHLPEFDHGSCSVRLDSDQVNVTKTVVEQLRHYVQTVAGMYRDNPFHNFEHASHVMMSVNKLMSRIVAPSHLDIDEPDMDRLEDDGDDLMAARIKKVAATLHDHTYGITSDPLTQFACAVSALIHDVDHQGVPNAQLVQEEEDVARKYDNRSPAEQNSLELAWDLLMSETYTDLRGAICATEDERSRFRQLLVNSVMATDIADKNLKVLRNARWDKAFKKLLDENGNEFTESRRDAVNRKATIVIEHLIQASDVSHTMQHWHIYRRWNENLFRECYMAYLSGRADTDPSKNWYKGEIGFFDFYVIPLAKKLKECGVFGKSSGEFLNYAMDNRTEWEHRGDEVTKSMLKKLERELEKSKTQSLGHVHHTMGFAAQ